MTKHEWLKMRLAQICADLVQNHYIIVSQNDHAFFLRHPNGNRITMMIDDDDVLVMRNGCLVKSEHAPVTCCDNLSCSR